MEIRNMINKLIDNHNYTELSLILNRENVDLVDENEQTFLMYAISKKNLNALKIIIEKGSNVNYIDKKGYSALCNAVIDNNTEIVEVLLKSGADVNVIMTAKGMKGNLLIISILNKNIQISKLLISYKININCKFEILDEYLTYRGYFNVLFFAISKKDFFHVKLLIENGINIDYYFDYKKYLNFNIFGFSLLMENIDIIKYIYEKTKNRFKVIEYLDRDDIENVTLISNMSCLEVLIIEKCCNKEVYNFLFENGIDINKSINYNEFVAVDDSDLIDDNYDNALHDVKHEIQKEEKISNRDFIDILEDTNYYKEKVQTIDCNIFVLYIIFEDDDNIDEDLIEFFVSKGLDLKHQFEFEIIDEDSANDYISLANLLEKWSLNDYLENLINTFDNEVELAEVLEDDEKLMPEVLKIDLGDEVFLEMVKVSLQCLLEKPELVETITKISKTFYISNHEITQKQWKKIINVNPSCYKLDENPVENVSWNNCQYFIDVINNKIKTYGLFCLPSETEWKCACKVGNGNHENFCESKLNCEGIYKIKSNLWEWCESWYSCEDSTIQKNTTDAGNSWRIFLGGSSDNVKNKCNTSCRNGAPATSSFKTVGFRIALHISKNYLESLKGINNVRNIKTEEFDMESVNVNLISACYKNDISKAKECLSNGADVNFKNNNGTTSLMLAVNSGNLELVKLLIESKADITIKSSNGLNAIQIAKAKGDINIVQLLNENNPMDIEIDIDILKDSKIKIEQKKSNGESINERESNEFFNEIGFNELVEHGILLANGSNFLMRAGSVDNLINLMIENGVEKIFYKKSGNIKWYLKSDGEFLNLLGPIRERHVSELSNKGDVFLHTNKTIHSFYSGNDFINENPEKLKIRPQMPQIAENCRESNDFFSEMGFNELIDRGILIPYGSKYQMKANSVENLIDLMHEEKIEMLYYKKQGVIKWYLKSDGEFLNLLGPIRESHVSELSNKGDVFLHTNKTIHPFYNGDV